MPRGADPDRADAVDDPDADFALTLSSAALRLAADRTVRPALADDGLAGARPSSVSVPAPARAPVPDPDQAGSTATPPPADDTPAPALHASTSRVIAAYREIARAPVGERVRILA